MLVEIEGLIGKYQLDGDDSYSFGRDQQFTNVLGLKHIFSASPVAICLKAEILFVDIN